MNVLRLLILGPIAFALAGPVSAQLIEGTATVIDGDTLDMTGTRIRLAHIDAPETKQTCEQHAQDWACGADATAEMVSIIGGQAVSCTIIDTDVYGRQVAVCRNRVFDIGRELVRRGMAIVLDGAPFEYVEASEIARGLCAGLWSSAFEIPSQWRAANPQSAPRAESLPSRQASRPMPEREYRNEFGCAIKGNRNRRGEWIYHLPGRPYYEQTRPEELFCTEREAQAAGYRRSKA